jgi:CheY-like chemotaxis protein
LVRDLRVFSRSDVAERPTVFSARAAIEQALRLVRREFGPRTIVEQDYENDLPKLCLPKNRLAQILTNLLLNAAHAMREVDRPLHRIRITARSDDQHIALSISDTGPGIPADSLEKIFDPFYTTKRESQGTGLGLSISRSIVQHLGGDLAVSSFDGQGATFVCFLPLPSEQELESAERRRSPTPTAQLDPARQAVLIVEDDPHVLRAVSRVLGEEFKVLVAADGQEAIEVLSSGAKVDAIITEIALPEVDGPEFFAWIARESPELLDRIVVATAAQERTRYHDFLRRQKPTVLHKPLTRERVLSAVRQAANPKANSRSASS